MQPNGNPPLRGGYAPLTFCQAPDASGEAATRGLRQWASGYGLPLRDRGPAGPQKEAPVRGKWWSNPILSSLTPVVQGSGFVTTNEGEVQRVATWMAAEEFPDFRSTAPAAKGPFDIGPDPDKNIDLTMLITILNFAFTDFATSKKFEVTYNGVRYSDSEAMFACLHKAILAGQPILTGQWAATVTRRDLEELFRGDTEMPMLDERVVALNTVGTALTERYDGKWHRWVASCAPALYASGDGLLERLVTEFPRFDDVSDWKGHKIQIQKLSQLGLWGLHRGLAPLGRTVLKDPEMCTAFADYIVPVALRTMGIFEYEVSLEKRIMGGEMIPRDSLEEIEIRAHSIYATALLTDEVNARRPADKQLLIPEVDYRLWKTYHATHYPHHLTRTIMY